MAAPNSAASMIAETDQTKGHRAVCSVDVIVQAPCTLQVLSFSYCTSRKPPESPLQPRCHELGFDSTSLMTVQVAPATASSSAAAAAAPTHHWWEGTYRS
jgi:hypothetical protein